MKDDLQIFGQVKTRTVLLTREVSILHNGGGHGGGGYGGGHGGGVGGYGGGHGGGYGGGGSGIFRCLTLISTNFWQLVAKNTSRGGE